MNQLLIGVLLLICDRYRFKETLLSTFFYRWSQEYLGELKVKESGKTGLLVWLRKFFPCKDGLVKAAKVKTSLGYFVRPINKLYLLEGSSEAQLADVTVSNDDESQGIRRKTVTQ